MTAAPSRPPLVCIITGEPSGDLLGGRLMDALRRATGGTVDFMGVGGESMAARGLDSLIDQRELAVMGFIEVVPKIPRILRRVRELTQTILDRRPDVLITIDSWGFTKRVHRSVRAASAAAGWKVPQLHYVAPMVWAWKEKRARDVARTVDHLLCLLPNEPAYFERHGLPVTHVGHPVVEGGAGQGDRTGFRASHHLGDDSPLLVVLPGSRRSETSRLLPVFGEAVAILARRHPGLRVVVPTVATVADQVEQQVRGWAGTSVVLRGEQARYDAFAAGDVALAASGTVSLELAMAGLPHLVAYRVAASTAWLFRRLTSFRYANLINYILDRFVIPEVLQEDCTALTLANTIDTLLTDASVRAGQRDAFAQAMMLFGGGEGLPSDRAARVVLDAIASGEG
ncbi:lipid-A-disaccharide synthase [Insolitispirillum peregrinum]|uniref:lipid-A-disaccharide synthase n=1 Tax=Insolitispirillum peregrinum TaxID=80876 RepID=UPI003609C7C4